MQKRHLKRAAFVTVRGLLLVIIAVALQWGHYLSRPESWMYDEREIHCQQFRPPPSKSFVHLDVDDNALNYIGHWPWPPLKMARIIDEIALTKPKILAMDVLWVEPREIVYGKNDPVGVDEDRVLAKSMANLGCALVPMSFKFDLGGPPSKVSAELLKMLVADPELPQPQCIELLRRKGFTDADFNGDPNFSFFSIREHAFYERIWREISAHANSPPDAQTIKHMMLPHADPMLTKTVLGDLFDQQYDLIMRERAVRHFTLPLTKKNLPLLHASEEEAPILPLGEAAAFSAHVNFLPEILEGKVRRVPLFVQYRDRLIPQMAFVTACAMLGADIQKVRLEQDSVTIPRPNGPDIVIPVSQNTTQGQAGMLMEVPFYGRPNDWLTMYDFPRYQKQTQHVSAYEVWRICETLDKLQENRAFRAENLIKALYVLHRDSEGVNFLNLQSEDQKKQFIRDTLDGPNGTGSFVKNLAATLAEAPDPDFQKSLDSVKAADANLRLVNEQNERLEEQLQQFRTELYAKLHGHAIFFGGTATGLLDLRPTSLIGECPGVVIHGAIYNAVLTGKIPRVVDPDIDHAITAVIGIFTLLIVLRLAPLFAFIASLTLALGYLAFNGYFLFAYKNLIVSAAGPIVAIGLVWSVVTLTNILTEIAEKSRITRRFRNYVDPSLVDWVVDHPDNVRFDGERREMTVCFSDLVGFTTLTDELGERVVPLLAEYMGKMVPVIRSHNGYVAQLIGDGIYFFFGAPQTNQSHAEHAVQTALGMHKALEHFNITLRERSSKMLGMRIGISTGEVVIGDAGTADASAYTAMGATTNLASRLESANKVFGTHTLITARTVELLNGDYLVRPIANVRVAGKLNSVVVYEPLGLKSECTEQDRALVDCTTKIFQAYRNADFIGCITACADMDQLFGSSKLTKLYTHLSNEHVTTSATDFCEGQIVLTEK